MFPFYPFSTPAEMMRLTLRSAATMAEAQSVIAMRMAGMLGLWRVSPEENGRMLTEKLQAAQESGLAAARAAIAGHSPASVADKALSPYRRRTRANATRLTKRGPGSPA
jgi:hypothetical protein